MMLTLGQAAKQVKLSKTAISNAIKDGRLSANRKENGHYEIDPAELFRVYPSKGSSERETLTEVNPETLPVNGSQAAVLSEKVKGLNGLLEEKDKQIRRLIDEKEKTEELLDEQLQQSKRMTLLLENHSKEEQGGYNLEKRFKALEAQIANQRKQSEQQKQREEKVLRQNKMLKKALNKERNKGFFERLFG